MIINLLIINLLKTSHYPTILIHGIGGDTSDLDDIQNYLLSQNISVHNIEIGNGKLDSIFMNINDQCYSFGQNIKQLNLTTTKINILGVILVINFFKYLEKFPKKITFKIEIN